MECTKCGHQNAGGSNFCSNCGERLLLSGPLAGDSTSIIPIITDDTGEIVGLSADLAEALDDLPRAHAMLVVERGAGDTERFLLDDAVVSAGRHPESDIFLDDITVSRHHAQFLREGEQWSVADQNSLNGTYVNRTLVDGQAVLRPGDEVQIGKFRMVFFVSDDPVGGASL